MLDLKATFNTLNHKDILIRALKTGVTVFVVTLAGSLVNIAALPSLSDLEKLLLAALSAAGTAVLNYAIQLSTNHIQTPNAS